MGSITKETWGTVDGVPVKKFVLKNARGYQVDVISYGATITSIKVPDKVGDIADVVLGFDNIKGYIAKNNPYFGATVGRVANRIGKARFVIDGVQYNVSNNVGANSLHGGTKGWSMKVWNGVIEGDKVVMTLLSEDGDEGFPGAAIAVASFHLSDDGELMIEMTCFTSKATPINLTNHSYFNLAGHGSNVEEIKKHKVRINADRWTVTDSDSIPTGEIRSVDNTIMDLRMSAVLGDVIYKVPGGGYDYNFCLPETKFPGLQPVSKVTHPPSGRFLEVRSNQPGVQFYTANSLPEMGATGILGKNGNVYYKHGAFCLETQNYPDAVNHDNFPNSVVRPGAVYHHIVTYKFGVMKS